MTNFTPRKIIGKWREGMALDLHTLSSEFIGHDEFGHPRFDTVRSLTPRPWQPVTVLAEAISKRTGIVLVDCVTRTRDAPQLKNVFDLDQRLKLLDGLHAVDKTATQGKGVLLFDDLYRSGAT